MPPTEHSRLGASGAYRWMACPGSFGLEDAFDDTTSVYAAEGTAAHELAEICLHDDCDTDDLIGASLEVEDWPEQIVVTEEMAHAVQVYVDHVRSLSESGSMILEHRFSLRPLNPPVEMFGTADCVIWDGDDKVLQIWDYKHGRGVPVEVSGNPQLRYYALGAMIEIGEIPEKIVTGIVQPRCPHDEGPVRSAEYTLDEIVAFKNELMAAAHAAVDAADEPTEHLQVGEHCRFCKAKGVCPAQREHAVTVAQTNFDTLEERTPAPAPAELTEDQMLAVLEHGDDVKAWIDEVHHLALERCLDGDPPEGWKAIEGRAYRKWHDEEAADTYLKNKGLKVAERFKPRSLISPYQAEKAIRRIVGENPDDLNRLQRLINNPTGKPKLARADHKKPAITRVAAEDAFDALPASDD